MYGFGFGVWGSPGMSNGLIRADGFDSTVERSGLRVWGIGYMVSGLGFRVSGFGQRV